MSTTGPRPISGRVRPRRWGSIVCEITNPFYAELTAGIDEALDRAGWVAFLANTAESPQRQDRFIERMREHRVDGLLLSPAEGTDPEIIERLHRLGLPVVQVLRRLGRARERSCGRGFPPRHDAGGRASHRARPSPPGLRRRRQARLPGAGPGRCLSSDPEAPRPAHRADHRLPADPRGRRESRGPPAHRRPGRSDSDPLPQRRLRLRRAGRARRPRAGGRRRIAR